MRLRPAFFILKANFVVLILFIVASVFCFFSQSAALRAAEPEDISGRASKLLAAENIPGAAVFIIHKGVPVYRRAFGCADVKSETKFDFDKTVFAAGSLSKIVTAAAVLKLSETKRIALDSPVAGCLAGTNGPSKLSGLPVFKKAGNITPMSLLTHSSGFANCADLYAKKPSSPRAISAPASAPPPAFDFIAKNIPRFSLENINAKFEYSNFNYALLGHLIEESENISFDEYIKNNIFLPLKMNYSSFSLSRLSSSLEEAGYEVNFASGYDFSDGESSEAFYREHNMPAASGLLTSAADVEKFAAMLVSLSCRPAGTSRASAAYSNAQSGPAVISAETAALLFKPRLPVKKSEAPLLDAFPEINSMAAGFRHSLFRGRDIFWHTGSVRGFSCGLYISPQTSSAFFIACNSSNPAFRRKFIKYLLEAFCGPK